LTERAPNSKKKKQYCQKGGVEKARGWWMTQKFRPKAAGPGETSPEKGHLFSIKNQKKREPSQELIAEREKDPSTSQAPAGALSLQERQMGFQIWSIYRTKRDYS